MGSTLMKKEPLSRQGSDLGDEESLVGVEEGVMMRPQRLPATQPRSEGMYYD